MSRQWICTTCSKSFARKGDLTRHTSIHTGIKPHICETCGKGFAQFSGLKTHRNIHSKAKPFVCGIGTCTKAFGDPSSRTRHRKETHRREGAYKCVVAECGTRIKRRSAFMAHLRKHGIDPHSVDLNTAGLTPAPAEFAPPDADTESHHATEPHNAFSSFLNDNPGYHTLGGGEASRFLDSNGGLDAADSRDYRRTHWPQTIDVFPPDPALDQLMNVDLSGLPGDVNSYLSSNIEDPLYFDGIFPTPVVHPLRAPSPLNLSAPESFPEVVSDESQSSTSSPSSTYLTLYPTDFNDDLMPPPLMDEPALYNLM